MRTFKTRWFHRWAIREEIEDSQLLRIAQELAGGLVGANLGGHVYKKRLALNGIGKRGGARVLVLFRHGGHAFLAYGFAKRERDNVGHRELAALRRLADELLNYDDEALMKAVDAGELVEVRREEA